MLRHPLVLFAFQLGISHCSEAATTTTSNDTTFNGYALFGIISGAFAVFLLCIGSYFSWARCVALTSI